MTSNHSAAAPAPDALADRPARLEPGAAVGGRQAVLPNPLRMFHQRLLAAFLTETAPPNATVAAGLAAKLRLDPRAALAALAAADLVHTDPTTGSIAVAYPFRGLALPASDHRAVIRENRRWRCLRHSRRLVLPLHHFHTDREAADTYRGAHPGMTATVFGQAEAVKAARRAYGGLLDPAHPQETAP
jgi:hypothetical protein